MQHVVQGGDQSIGHLKVALITGKVKRDQHPIRQSTVAVGAGILVEGGIAHVDHHVPRRAVYPALPRIHYTRPAAPDRNLARAVVIT